MSRLADAWAKLDWAKVHFEEFKTKIGQWISANKNTAPFEIDHKFDATEGCFIDRIGELKSLPPEWPLIAGDILHNFRSALEYIAWQVAAPPKPRSEENVGFPIYIDPNDFSPSNIGRLLPGVKPEHLTVIKKYQPYNRNPTNPKEHCFAILNELNRLDKHRKLQLVLLYTKTYTARLESITDFANAHLVPPPVLWGGIPQLGAELARVHGEILPGKEPKVRVKYEGAASVAFEQGWFVENAFNDMGVEIAALLGELEPIL